MLIQYTMFGINFLVPSRFLIKLVSCDSFLYDTFYGWVSKRSQKIFLHKTVNIYPCTTFMDKRL